MKKKLGLAISITAEAFKDRYDRGGKPYILHCLYVMNHAAGNDDEKCAYVMHDLIEDTNDKSKINYTLKKLRCLGFSERTIEILEYMTHDPADSYNDYIITISADYSAIKCKMADLEHNSCITRLKGITEKDHKRIEKYNNAYVYLTHKLKEF